MEIAYIINVLRKSPIFLKICDLDERYGTELRIRGARQFTSMRACVCDNCSPIKYFAGVRARIMKNKLTPFICG